MMKKQRPLPGQLFKFLIFNPSHHNRRQIETDGCSTRRTNMNMRLIVLSAVAASMMAGTALAQSSTVNGAASGAVTGAIVGGPVGAAVGGVAGAIIGTAIDPPPQQVVQYVQQAPAPQPVVVKEKMAVGVKLPETVVVTPVPENPKYAYAVVNERRVIVEPQSRQVIQVIE
jgi:hypothetical protein